MEKSHHAAKAANQHHTQHNGTKDRTSAIVQQYQHWYRNYSTGLQRRNDCVESTTLGQWKMTSSQQQHCRKRGWPITHEMRWREQEGRGKIEHGLAELGLGWT